MAATIIRVKGFADIFVAAVLACKPTLIYHSIIERKIAELTGMKTPTSTAPGSNQAIACMVAAVGVGHVVAAMQGPDAHTPILAMNLTWAILCLASCLTPRSWDLGNATMLMSGFNHLAFSVALYFAGRSPLRTIKSHKD